MYLGPVPVPDDETLANRYLAERQLLNAIEAGNYVATTQKAPSCDICIDRAVHHVANYLGFPFDFCDRCHKELGFGVVARKPDTDLAPGFTMKVGGIFSLTFSGLMIIGGVMGPIALAPGLLSIAYGYILNWREKRLGEAREATKQLRQFSIGPAPKANTCRHGYDLEACTTAACRSWRTICERCGRKVLWQESSCSCRPAIEAVKTEAQKTLEAINGLTQAMDAGAAYTYMGLACPNPRSGTLLYEKWEERLQCRTNDHVFSSLDAVKCSCGCFTQHGWLLHRWP